MELEHDYDYFDDYVDIDPSILADWPAEKDKKHAKEASGIAAAVTKQTAGKFS